MPLYGFCFLTNAPEDVEQINVTKMKRSVKIKPGQVFLFKYPMHLESANTKWSKSTLEQEIIRATTWPSAPCTPTTDAFMHHRRDADRNTLLRGVPIPSSHIAWQFKSLCPSWWWVASSGRSLRPWTFARWQIRTADAHRFVFRRMHTQAGELSLGLHTYGMDTLHPFGQERGLQTQVYTCR